MDKKSFQRAVRKKDQVWKVDEYSGIKGEKSHDHKTLSGASIVGEEAVGGDIYYYRKDGKTLVNLNEKGDSLI